jgi:hypothetical protein
MEKLKEKLRLKGENRIKENRRKILARFDLDVRVDFSE